MLEWGTGRLEMCWKGLEGRNENGDCLIELCRERGLKVMNTWFEKKGYKKDNMGQ